MFCSNKEFMSGIISLCKCNRSKPSSKLSFITMTGECRNLAIQCLISTCFTAPVLCWLVFYFNKVWYICQGKCSICTCGRTNLARDLWFPLKFEGFISSYSDLLLFPNKEVTRETVTPLITSKKHCNSQRFKSYLYIAECV